MNDVDEQQLFSELELEQLFSDSRELWEYGTNICLPSYAEQPQNLLASDHFSPLPSPVTTEGFALSAGHLPYGGSHTPNATGTVDFSVAMDLEPCQSQWTGMSSSLTQGTRACVPQPQTQYQIPHGPLCGWPRDFEPSLATPSIPSIPQPLSQTLTPSYLNVGQYDAWTCHEVLGGSMDTCASSPDGDTTLSGFLGALADYDFPLHARADRQPSMALTHNNAISSIQSAALPSNEPIYGPDLQTRIFGCQWLSNSAPCEVPVTADRRSVMEHLQRTHGIRPGEEKMRQTCLWEGCRTILNKESLARHILTVHLKEKVHCAECGLFFAREDSLKRHLKGGLHKGPSGKARQLSRSHTGFRMTASQQRA